MEQALDILGSVPLIDGHNDWPHLIRGFYDNKLDSRFGRDSDLVGHVDMKRLLQGRSGGAFWSVYIDCPTSDDYTNDEAHFEVLRDTLQQIDLVHRLVYLHRDDMGLVQKASDVMDLFRAGKFAGLIGVEGLHQIANSPSILRLYHKLGVRYVTLAHSKNNLYADSAVRDLSPVDAGFCSVHVLTSQTSAAPSHGGLSTAGCSIIREMNRIGMIIDLSHTSEAVMRQTLELSTAPVIFSHSSAASVVPHPRNVPDDILLLLKRNKGVIMICFIPSLAAVNDKEAGLDSIVDHILHVANLIGFAHIGLGSDFDGMFSAVRGIDDVAHYPSLVMKMLERGIDRSNVEKIIGLNVIRVMEQVESISASCYDKLPVMDEEVKQLWNDKFRAAVKQVYPNTQH